MPTKDPASGDGVPPVALDPIDPSELPRRALVLTLTDGDTGSPLTRLFDDVVLVGPGELRERLPSAGHETCLAYTAGDRVPAEIGDLLARPSALSTVLVGVSRETTTGPAVPRGWTARGRLVTDGVTALVLDRTPPRAPGGRAAGANEAALRRAVLGADGEPEHLLRDAVALAEAARASRSEARAALLRDQLEQTRDELTRVQGRLAELREQRDQARKQLRDVRNSPLGFLAVLSEKVRRRGLTGLAGSPAAARLLRTAAAAGLGLGFVLAVSWAVASATSSGYPGGAATAVALLVVADILLGIRGRRALARSTRGVNTTTRLGIRAHKERLDDVRRSARELSRLTQQVTERQTAVQRQLEILAATSTDIAAVVRNLPGLPGTPDVPGQPGTGGGHASSSQAAREAAREAARRESLDDLYSLVEPQGALPELGGWAVAPDALLLLVDELLQLRPHTVVECGSGSSTVWLALAVRRFQLPTRIVALEHLEEYRKSTIDLLTAHEVQDLAEVRLAPLQDPGLPGHPSVWYARQALDGIDQVGLLFVDGPPELTGPMARFPAVPLLRDRLAAEATIVLDDTIRPDETKIAELWADELPDFEVEHLPLEKGAAVFRRRSGG